MQKRIYTAIDGRGRVQRGHRTAADTETLAKLLADEGLILLGHRRCFDPSVVAFRYVRPDTQRMAVICGQMAQLLDAGLSMLAVLDELIAQETQRTLRVALESVRSRVNQGDSLSIALSRQPALFDARVVATLQAGEAGGQLSACLLQLERSLQWQAAARARLVKLLCYPLTAGIVVCCAMAFVLLYLLPEFGRLLNQIGAEPPRSTRLVLAMADVAVQSTPALLLLPVLPCLWWSVWFRGRFDACLIGAGGVGRVVVELQLARYAECVALLYANRVALVEALRLAEPLLASQRLRSELIEVRLAIVNGSAFADALGIAVHCPPVLRQLVASGESAGSLAVALHHAADQLQQRAIRALDRFEALLPSLVLAFVGVLLLSVVLTVLLPVYDAVMAVGAL